MSQIKGVLNILDIKEIQIEGKKEFNLIFEGKIYNLVIGKTFKLKASSEYQRILWVTTLNKLKEYL